MKCFTTKKLVRWLLGTCVILFVALHVQQYQYAHQHHHHGGQFSQQPYSITRERESFDNIRPSIAKPGGKRKVQKIVILPGPHKTGSTSVQSDLYKWTTTESRSEEEQLLFNDWSWPVPSNAKFNALGTTSLGREKGFAMMANRLVGLKKFGNPDVSDQAILNLYKQEFQKAWNQGQNILIAAEYLDLIGNYEQDPTKAQQQLDGLLGLLPTATSDVSNVERQIIVGIHHRRPRIDHLISLWHQWSRKPLGKVRVANNPIGSGQSLSDFILSPTGLAMYGYQLNSLALTNAFWMKNQQFATNIEIMLIDTSGVREQSLDLSDVVACQVLGVELPSCQSGSTMDDAVHHDTLQRRHMQQQQRKHAPKNKRKDTGDRDLDFKTLKEIDLVLQGYDCQFQSTINKDNGIQILYNNNLFQNCSLTPSTLSSSQTPMTFSDVLQTIHNLVNKQNR